jgi:hypothetical protein
MHGSVGSTQPCSNGGATKVSQSLPNRGAFRGPVSCGHMHGPVGSPTPCSLGGAIQGPSPDQRPQSCLPSEAAPQTPSFEVPGVVTAAPPRQSTISPEARVRRLNVTSSRRTATRRLSVMSWMAWFARQCRQFSSLPVGKTSSAVPSPLKGTCTQMSENYPIAQLTC